MAQNKLKNNLLSSSHITKRKFCNNLCFLLTIEKVLSWKASKTTTKIGSFYSLDILISCHHTCNCPKWHCATSIFVVHLICPNGPNGYHVIVPKGMEWWKKIFAFAMLFICDSKSKSRCFNKTWRILGHYLIFSFWLSTFTTWVLFY